MNKLPRGRYKTRSKRLGLTARQQIAEALVLKGLTNKEIAEQMGISFKTVKFHLVDVYKHYGVSSRAELIIRKHEEATWIMRQA